ncbi:DUF2798 domain-containing protein [Allorhizobium undicola]|uniref:DUF2798 domain-containing protein n=1 Tax=Allorhizobium undicola TaxID=78527 RepID=UPI00048260FC|nr:DUF2798 domain-containing protein [Allorhizobium undicola]
MNIQERDAARRRYKLHHRTGPLVSAFFTANIMALIMCAGIAAVSGGLTYDLMHRTWNSWQTAMPMAFLAVLIVRPIVTRLTALCVHPPA